MLRFRFSLFCLLSLLLSGLRPSAALAQVVTVGPDSAKVARRPAAFDSTRRTERLLGMRVTRPQKATLLALVLPGAGQIYNRRYWKLPLVYGGLGGVGYGLYFYQTAYREYVDGRDELIADPDKLISTLSGKRVSQETSRANVQRGINFYRSRRDTFIGYTAVVYGITILDALVDAHLRNFDISDDLSLRLDPTMLPSPGQAPRAGLALTLHLK
ncbi:DUF5683 domain-containing protein [Hymenobacter psychrophilus]|uniref:DUF5683 domain-containing protein n=1 Tax=Hymenobacter psychrophilus TaxID=651662 RepID=A0A1H3G1D9_9BACT|nr:DUF5683 domain-containing protein [Hymenobacter psychrophilus]SDX96179.1 hypothetical protein SAMN04488069_104278 [Hymenobacter psychrophilus]